MTSRSLWTALVSPVAFMASVFGLFALSAIDCAKPTAVTGDQCPAGGLSCGGTCVDPKTDESNCGACGVACSGGHSCQDGQCLCQGGLSACGNLCVNLQSDPAHCGACGTSCAAGQVCNQSACSSSCSSGLTNCSGACANLMTDSQNCGSCGHACAAGLACSNGQCGCPSGQTLCGTNCVDTNTSAVNCGMCGKSCAATQTCNNGTCGCASGQVTCPNGTCAASTAACNGGSGGSGGGSGGAGGGAGGSGGGGGGPVLPMPKALTCPNNISIPAADVISDFAQTTPIMYSVGTRGGTTWYAYGADDTTNASTGLSVPGGSTPGVGSNVFAVDSTTSGPCNSGGSLKVSSTGNTGYGIGFGVNLMPDVSANTKGLYNAMAAGYTGFGFWAKCSKETDFVFVKEVDQSQDANVANPVCNYSSGTICNQFGQKNTTVLADWSFFKVYFADALQDWDGGSISTGNVASNALSSFQIQVNTQYTRDGSARVANPFTCWFDDVVFIKDTPPSAGVAPKTCTSATASMAAPGGYYTSGNQIFDCKTGTAKIFRGIARPSMEWDRAGWDVIYDDLARIQSWGADVVRFSLNEVFWLDTAKGGLYQRTVDRAVKWSLALGMDVILDLHWTGSGTTYGQMQMPVKGHGVSFWSQVAAKYKNDGRVMFELYNEPFGDATTWKSGSSSFDGMQDMYNAVRNTAGAKNLVLIGGLDYAYHLDQVLPANALSGTNIAYVTHPYQFKAADATSWDPAFGNLSATYPIIATEFGQANISQAGGTQTCDGTFYTNIINYFKTKKIGWTSWAWHVERAITDPTQTCGFPQLIVGYGGATNPAGAVVKNLLSMP